MENRRTGQVSVVGAGPVGSMLAIYLARQGYEVEVFERRPDMRRETISAGRSINLALSVRGLHALQGIGMDRQALAEAVPMRGRTMHSPKGELTFQPYGKEDSDCIYSMSRGGLNKMLMTAAEKTGAVSIRFDHKAVEYAQDGKAVLLNEKTGEKIRSTGEVIFGTDGSASVIRDGIARRTGAEVSQTLLDYGYKELQLPAGPGGKHQLDKNSLHIWPRGAHMLIALPNFDGSFTCTLFLSLEGAISFETLTTREAVRKFFTENFSDVTALFPALEDEFFENPTGRMVTVKCDPWSWKGESLLVGDAAHAIVPFFGQGLNCGFEDCSVLNELMSAQRAKTDWSALFSEFNLARKTNTDAIADMAVENFTEMRDKVADPRFLLQKQVERVLEREFPGRYVSRYGMVTFSRVPYRQALDTGLVQTEILAELCRDIGSVDQLDLAFADRLIKKLAPKISL